MALKEIDSGEPSSLLRNKLARCPTPCCSNGTFTRWWSIFTVKNWVEEYPSRRMCRFHMHYLWVPQVSIESQDPTPKRNSRRNKSLPGDLDHTTKQTLLWLWAWESPTIEATLTRYKKNIQQQQRKAHFRSNLDLTIQSWSSLLSFFLLLLFLLWLQRSIVTTTTTDTATKV